MGQFQKGHVKNPNSGAKKGQISKVTEECRRLARIHGPDTIKELARLALSAEDERARVMACKEILDRGYGRTIPPMTEDGVQVGGVRVVIIGDDAKL